MGPATHIRLGTRASQLAMWQSNWVKHRLEDLGIIVDLIQISTEGDDQKQPLSQIGGQGLFTKRLQTALLRNEIDLAVHSLKDLPTQETPGLTIAAVPPRENSADVLVSNGVNSFESLHKGAIVGTGSVRRAAQLLHLREDLKVSDIRGNVDTRLRKLDEGLFDAIVLAAAGLLRLGLKERMTYVFPTQEMMPAVGQGALGLETRADDEDTVGIVKKLNHYPSYCSVLAERAMLRKLFAGCLSPIGVETTVAGDRITLQAIVLSRDGRQKVTSFGTGLLPESAELGVEVAESLIEKGADRFLRDDPA